MPVKFFGEIPVCCCHQSKYCTNGLEAGLADIRYKSEMATDPSQASTPSAGSGGKCSLQEIAEFGGAGLLLQARAKIIVHQLAGEF